MDEINLQLFGGGGARSGLGGGRANKDAENSKAKTYRFWYRDENGNIKYIDVRGDTPKEALQIAKIKLNGKKIIRGGVKKDGQQGVANIIDTVSSVTDSKSGNKIDLSDSKLSYTSPPSTVDSKHLDSVKSIAKKIQNKTKENLTVFDKNGNVIYNKEGDINNVGAPKTVMQQAGSDIHNHGRGEGVIGGTFSVIDDKGKGDMQSFVGNSNLKTSFASTKEGLYYISKTDNFKGAQFIRHMKHQETSIMKKMNSDLKELNKMRETGKINYEQYKSIYRKTKNAALVKMHNEYIKGQKQYEYEYGLIKQ